MKLAAVALLVTSLASCGMPTSDSETKIVGGRPVSKDHEIAKYTVSLIKPGSRLSFCSGTLIDSRHVVTAAHCLLDIGFKPLVGFGVKARAATVVKSRAYVANSEFNVVDVETGAQASAVNDIGLIELEQDAPSAATPAKILNEGSELKYGEHLVLAGFGYTSAVLERSAGTLRSVTTQVKALSKERKELDSGGLVGKSACTGDSGGPAFVTREGVLVLAGVTSRGSPNCGEEGSHTDMRYFSQWLRDAKEHLATQKTE